MKNIRNEEDYAEIKLRIAGLNERNIRRWGKMDLLQMLAHCTMQLKLALGEVPSETQGPSFMRSRLGKWMLLSAIPWPKGAQTPAEMNTDLSSFSFSGIETGKSDLLDHLEKARSHAALKPHPFFGKLSQTEWGRLIYKHMDHHLKQFSS
ncbi:DUF1569 domain-containing protein [Flavitalea antarctica]